MPRPGIARSSRTSAEGGLVEVDFAVPLFESRDRTVGIKGTIDYAAPDGTLYDWKTTSKKYDQRDKQKAAIQPTVYATAAMHGALPSEYRYEYPIRFHYGVMVRGEAEGHDPDRGRAAHPRPRGMADRPPAHVRRRGRRARGEAAVAAQRGPLPVQRDVVPVVVDLQGRADLDQLRTRGQDDRLVDVPELRRGAYVGVERLLGAFAVDLRPYPPP